MSGDLAAAPAYVAAVEGRDDLVLYDPAGRRVCEQRASRAHRHSPGPARATGSDVTCRPVFERLAGVAARYAPDVVADVTGAPAETIVAAARLLSAHRPVSHYFHNGLVQHTNATQASRAIEILYALLGDFDRPGGNVPGPAPRVNDVSGRAALPEEMAARRIGRAERPIGPAVTPGTVTAYDLYRAILEGEPYPVRAVLSFGANALLANGDTLQGRAALERLEFFAQVELVHTPTSRFADVLLPAADWMECSALKVGHRYPVEAMAHLQFRTAAVPPLHQRRSDVEIIFDLAVRLGLGDAFWDGDVEAGYRHLLEPSGLSLEELRQLPHGISAPRAPLGHRRFADVDGATGRAARLRDADEEGRAVVAPLRRSRAAAAARVRGAGVEPGEPARSRRQLPARPHERQAAAVHAQPAPRPAEPPEGRAESDGRDPPGDGRALRCRPRRVDRGGDAFGAAFASRPTSPMRSCLE